MTWEAAEAEAPPRVLVSLTPALATIAAVVMLLIYSGGWRLLGETSESLERFAYLPAYALAFLLLLVRPSDLARASVRQPFLIVLMGLVVISIAWSVQPEVSMRRAFALGGATLSGLALAARFRWADLARVCAATFAVLVAASYLVCLAAPSIGVAAGGWRGLWAESAELGGLMALGCCVLGAAVLLDPSHRALWLVFAGLAVGLVLMARSGSGVAVAALGLLALGFVCRGQRAPSGPAGARATVALGLLLLATFMLLALNALLGEEAGLSGRRQVWEAAMGLVEERPWLGYGYGAASGLLASTDTAQSGWIEPWLGLGLFGLTAWGLFYLQAMALAAVAVFRDRGALLALPVLAAFTLISLTQSVAVADNGFHWVLFVAIAAKLAFSDRLAEA